ncbi:MAG: hypothetical protein A2Y62_12510 [Candidatus Fischerbacteria bacterium RBG_13_37_8]|uniref:Major facilitator superfamily (MFS) profile domain-containing protein n=1 Tax=Candidatus Fischerbacteria bacterium RBG_13_37_8 TaxID=1817863 RepID=A0A1F5VSR9_9BACT|nr:MAG: hypothetical protein A2Y62_12510 [Candidatus Fischerbacteria bacterium RBG_13_37_8]
MIKKIGHLYKEAYTGLPRDTWILAIAEFINRSGFMVLFFLNIYLTDRLGFNLSKAGQVISAYGIGAIIGSYLGGWLCEYVGAFRILKLSFALSGIFLIIAGQISTFWILFLLILLYGTASSAFFPASDTVISQLCEGELRSRGYALRRLASNLGITIGPAVGGYLVLVDYHLLFWVDGITSLAAAVFLYEYLKKGFETKNIQSNTEIVSISPFKDIYFLVYLVFFLILMTAFAQLFSTFPLYLYRVYQLPESRIGPLLAVNTIIIVLFEMVLLYSLRKKPVMNFIILGSLLIGCGYALLPLGRSFLFAAFTVIVWTMGEIFVLPLSTTAVANRAGASAGRYLGLYSLTFALSMLISPIIGNNIYDAWGGNILWLSVGIVGLICAVGFLFLRHKITQQP